MPGLVPGVANRRARSGEWMAGTGPAMTTRENGARTRQLLHRDTRRHAPRSPSASPACIERRGDGGPYVRHARLPADLDMRPVSSAYLRAARRRRSLDPDSGIGGSRLDRPRTMRRRPRPLADHDRRRSPGPCGARPICPVSCGSSLGPPSLHRSRQGTPRACSPAPCAVARWFSAGAATTATSTVRGAAATGRDVGRCGSRGSATRTAAAAVTSMPSASGATANAAGVRWRRLRPARRK